MPSYATGEGDVVFSVDDCGRLEAVKAMETLPLLPDPREMAQAFARRDAQYDGVFFVAVRTTGIFCRPSCPSQPRPENVEFLPSIQACLFAGYRPCKRCHPESVDGTPPEWVTLLKRELEASPERRFSSMDLAKLGVSPERARRWFQTHYGMTFAAWCRAHRLGEAFVGLRRGMDLDEATLGAGFESHSGFREAFRRTFGEPPGRARETGNCVVVAMIESPVGPLLAGVVDEGVCLLEFTDRRMLETNLKAIRRCFGGAVVPGRHAVLDQLKEELADYFSGRRRVFEVKLEPRGTPFQMQVWQALGQIPYGTTIDYATLAGRVGNPTGQRAVARANGMNRISILIPCHRVIGKDGTLTGYGGGLWRKRLLLELERTGCFPKGG